MASTCEACGWAAAFCSMLAFGSFGVPIKSGAALDVDIDPLVMQSYKTAMCFLTSWLVLAAGEEFHFTPWGIVSGFFWVPGGVATIYAIKAAGLAIGIGIGSSFIVLVSFVWGIFVFDEQIHSRSGACAAIFLMMLGLFGMSYYSSPATIDTTAVSTEDGLLDLASPTDVVYQQVRENTSYSDEENDDNMLTMLSTTNTTTTKVPIVPPMAAFQSTKMTLTDRTTRTTYSDSVASDSVAVAEDPEDGDALSLHGHNINEQSSTASIQSSHVVMCGGVVLTKSRLGMLAAMFCGIWGGSILAPMKYSPPDTKGMGYLISFAIGASIVTLGLWLIRFLYYCHKFESIEQAYQNLPSFHFRKMWLAGGICGLLWSIGNFFSLFSVYYLGEGVGYPLVQTSILISGLWGIFFFKEVQGCKRITKWLLSSLLTIAGIILLSYEHYEK